MEKTREPFVKIDRVMELTGFSINYVYKLVHRKQIPHYKPTGGKGALRFRESEVYDFLNRSRKSADYELSENADSILNGEAK